MKIHKQHKTCNRVTRWLAAYNQRIEMARRMDKIIEQAARQEQVTLTARQEADIMRVLGI
jgi:hypothetical protein